MAKINLQELILRISLVEKRGDQAITHEAAQIFTAEDLKNTRLLSDALARAAHNGLQIVLQKALRGEE